MQNILILLQIIFFVLQILTLIMAYVAHTRGVTNASNIEQLEKNTNGIKNELLRVTAVSEYAKGVLHGKEEKKTGD